VLMNQVKACWKQSLNDDERKNFKGEIYQAGDGINIGLWKQEDKVAVRKAIGPAFREHVKGDLLGDGTVKFTLAGVSDVDLITKDPTGVTQLKEALGGELNFGTIHRVPNQKSGRVEIIPSTAVKEKIVNSNVQALYMERLDGNVWVNVHDNVDQCYRCLGYEHQARDCKVVPEGQARCHHCRQTGHDEVRCFSKARGEPPVCLDCGGNHHGRDTLHCSAVPRDVEIDFVVGPPVDPQVLNGASTAQNGGVGSDDESDAPSLNPDDDPEGDQEEEEMNLGGDDDPPHNDVAGRSS